MQYDPGQGPMELPSKLGPSTEIRSSATRSPAPSTVSRSQSEKCRVRSKASDASCAKSITA